MYQPPKHATVANVVPAGDFQQLQAQLEDTQESLAAAFARIEVFRLREKLLLAELAKSRIAGQPNVGTAPADAADAVTAVAAAETAEHSTGTADVCQQQGCSQPGSSPPQHKEQQQQQQVDQQADWPLPCYVTEVEGHLPVMLISSGGRKVRHHSAAKVPEREAQIYRWAAPCLAAVCLRGAIYIPRHQLQQLAGLLQDGLQCCTRPCHRTRLPAA